ncbi:hypothetical protein PILCRDRAFT_816153 [Piloderma croceum F 1598]|uniref:Uncharacterized protein n=1 Tax=Piloderma croceum (strain F 1598) TaxID=765440 RepID=A0A0C3BIT2_PILCF|nr:hypothetical protein PILCRDRAFT_816153 [Piloderma croceum F 1598]
MQGAAYSAYPYNTRTPYPAHYYPPQTFPNVYPQSPTSQATPVHSARAARSLSPNPHAELGKGL